MEVFIEEFFKTIRKAARDSSTTKINFSIKVSSKMISDMAGGCFLVTKRSFSKDIGSTTLQSIQGVAK